MSSSLGAVKHWPIYGVRPMMYSIHHPHGPHTIANWRAKFGWIAEQRYAPVVNGEWSQFAAARGECWADAPQRAPAYLTYLRGLHVGMTIWKIGKWTEPGTTQGVHTTTDPAVPTGFGVWIGSTSWRTTGGCRRKSAGGPATTHGLRDTSPSWGAAHRGRLPRGKPKSNRRVYDVSRP